MRKDLRWKDINFIGGHEKKEDRYDLKKTARRELLEEIPALRGREIFTLTQLTRKLEYGPLFSLSAGHKKKYILQFYILKLSKSPDRLLKSLCGRTKNVLIDKKELIKPKKRQISGIVKLLDGSLPCGINSIPYTREEDLRDEILSSKIPFDCQIEAIFD